MPVLYLLSLILRLAFAPFTAFGPDEAYVADRFSDPSLWPGSGGIVAYNGSLRPGILFTLLAGIPVKLAGGSPLGGMLALAVYGFLEAVVVLKIYRKLFPEKQPRFLAALILLAPWTIEFQSFFHASFAPVFGVLFFWALHRLLDDARSFWAWFAVPVSFIGCFQIGLYFVPLIPLLALCWINGLIGRSVNLRGLLLGTVMAAIPLALAPLLSSELRHYPFELDHPAYLETGTTAHPYTLAEIHALKKESQAAPGGLVSFEPRQLLQAPAHLATLLFRFLSFATGETTRFSGPGVPRNLELLNAHPWLWPFAVVALLGSFAMIWTGLRFYFNREILGRVRHAAAAMLGRRGAPGPLPETVRDRMDVVAWLLPWIYGSAFVFSVKGPSAHTFWILWPFAFYPLVRMVRSTTDGVLRFFPVYAACALVFSLGAAIVNDSKSTYFSARKAALSLPERGNLVHDVLVRQEWLAKRR